MHSDSESTALLIMTIIVVGPVILYFYYRDSNRPRGEVRPLYDNRGQQVLNKNGEEMYVDEYGKVFTYRAVMADQRRRDREEAQNREGCGCLSMMLLGGLMGMFK
ncbi:MAG: hypothetical protein IJ523_00115 [Succinivibrionaceae bacterium]|nr:hypothetical protein [Succinivibrionaceae bacterium]